MREEAVCEMLVHVGVGHGGQRFPHQRWHLAVQSQTCEDGGGQQTVALLPGERALADMQCGSHLCANLNSICVEITHVSHCKMSLRPLCLPPRAS